MATKSHNSHVLGLIALSLIFPMDLVKILTDQKILTAHSVPEIKQMFVFKKENVQLIHYFSTKIKLEQLLNVH